MRAWARLRAYLAPAEDSWGRCRCIDPSAEPSATMEEVVVDARMLPLDDQIARTLAACAALPEGGRIRHVNALVPWPLLALLDMRGWTYRLVRRQGGYTEILIWSRALCLEAMERRARTAGG